MSFRFDFGDEGECFEVNQTVTEEISSNPLDTVKIEESVRPKSHSFASLLESCLDKHIAYELVKVTSDCALYRRALFDVRHQLMFEDDGVEGDESGNREEMKILLGETGEDLRNGVYEGGLKSWECSYDVAEYLRSTNIVKELVKNEQSAIVEIGCGTALPTLYALEQLYDVVAEGRSKVKIVLTDFNYDVLRLVSVPNVFLSWANRFAAEKHPDAFARPGEVLCTREMIDDCVHWFEKHDIDVQCVSGAWGRQFVDLVDTLVGRDARRLVLTSETIYAPETLPVLCEAVCQLLIDGAGGDAVVAAKDIYFGVGGTVAEAQRVLEGVAARSQTPPLTLRRTVASAGAGGSVQRSLLLLAV